MQVIYYGDHPPYKYSKSIFLAGGSLRTGQEGESWRKDALQILEDMGYDGIIFIPENREGRLDENHSYDKTVNWEETYMEMADVILFWVPRKMDSLPCLTTNIEWGRYENSGKVILGFPEEAERMRYMHHHAKKMGIPVASNLAHTIKLALDKLGDGAERVNGERYIPLDIWRTNTFQQWYHAQSEAGNRIETAKILFIYHPSKHKDFIFSWIVKPVMYVASEDRYKDNEMVVGRTDISMVCLWWMSEDGTKAEVVLVKEYRSAATTSDGFIHELVGGSSFDQSQTPREVALAEIQEEIGLKVEDKRLIHVGTRQVYGTLLSHHSHLFSYRLDVEELEWLKSQKGIVHGNIEDGEQTYIEVVNYDDLKNSNLLDWGTLGQIATALKVFESLPVIK